MKKTKKLIETIVLVVIVIIAVLLLGFELFGESIIKTGVETAGTKALRVGVEINDLDLKIYSGYVKIKGFNVDNPTGYKYPKMLALSKGEVKTSLKSLMSDKVEIESIKLDGLALTIEQKGLGTNMQEVLKSMPKTEEGADVKSKKKLLVKDLRITNTTVKVKLLPIPGQADTITLKLDPIEMQNLGSDDDLTTQKLTKAILVALANGVAKQGAGIIPADIMGTIEGALGSLGDLTNIGQSVLKQGTDILKGGGGEASKILESGKDTGKEVIEGVKDITNIFNKKKQ